MKFGIAPESQIHDEDTTFNANGVKIILSKFPLTICAALILTL